MNWLSLWPFDKEQKYGLQIEGRVVKNQQCLQASYRLSGEVQKIVIPEARPPARLNGLWEKTCFELFVKHPDTTEYVEFNFSPNGDWNAYHFDGYRQGMRPLEEIKNIEIKFTPSSKSYELEATIYLTEKHSPLFDGHLQAGLSAVINIAQYQKSYWALQHSTPTPDFHLAANFSLKL